jgi:hypothetical protein
MADELGQKQQRASVGGGVQGRTGGPVLTSGGAAPSSSPAVRPPHLGSLLTTEIWRDGVWRWWDLLASSSSRPHLVRSAPHLLRSGSPSAAPRRAELESAEEGATTPPPPQHCRRHDTPAPSLSQHGALAGGHNLLGGGGFPDVTSSSTS